MATIEDYVKDITTASDAYWERMGYTFAPPPTYVIESGQRFYKIVKVDGIRPDALAGYKSSRSVHCFVEKATGNIYKAAGWSAPAKGIRGNINDVEKPLLGGQFYR